MIVSILKWNRGPSNTGQQGRDTDRQGRELFLAKRDRVFTAREASRRNSRLVAIDCGSRFLSN